MIRMLTGLICLGLYVSIEVQAVIQQKDFVVIQSKQVTNVDSMVSVRSRVRCADLCLQAGNCTSATFNSSNKECLLSADGLTNIIDVFDNNVATVLVKGIPYIVSFKKYRYNNYVTT